MKVPFKKIRPRYIRDIRNRRSIEKHVAYIGEVAWRWNNVCVNLMLVFSHLVDPKDYSIGRSIWLTLQSDKAQREILIALAKARLEHSPRILEEIIWICSQMGRLSGYRNAVIHAPVTVDVDLRYEDHVYVPEEVSSQPHFGKLGNENLAKVHKDLIRDLLLINQYVTYVFFHHLQPERWSLPRRPVMRVLLTKERPKSQTRRRGQ